MHISTNKGRIIAVLGPTNTGKTHFAMERMLAHQTGIIGFPLRLLARENYERAVAVKGIGQVALITGEEKILPPRSKYWICTAESMPLDRPVAFLALDEIQMCADPERGHIFTERLLRARGQNETMFMGAETMRPILRKLIPNVEFQTRARMSTLSYLGPKKLNQIPTRSALVAFSTHDVYATAELVRRQRGGSALVMGTLSPRTRNAQVAMFQNGEVDYLVATDAIGMGLNMDINHVSFTATKKFDGRSHRQLTASELGQIAGRAGRHMRNGSFGTSNEIGGFNYNLVNAIENHSFEPLPQIYWRNWKLDFQSTKRLINSLARPPVEPGLIRAREAVDEKALRALLKDQEINKLANNPDAIRLLWEVCRVPDFRKVMNDAHARFLADLYRHLRTGAESVPPNWMANQIRGLDRVDGDIDTLAQRIASVRTLTYISFRPKWLTDPRYWQDRTRVLEDQLSDALHDRLTKRFVDRRTAVLVKRFRDKANVLSTINPDGAVIIEGHVIGQLDGFNFLPDQNAILSNSDISTKIIEKTAASALREEILSRIELFLSSEKGAFELHCTDFQPPLIFWRKTRIAKVVKGETLLTPQVRIDNFPLLSAEQRDSMNKKLMRWLNDHLKSTLSPIYIDLKSLSKGSVRGIMFQLREHLGSMPRVIAKNEIDSASRSDRQELRKIGVQIQRESVLIRVLLKPDAIMIRGMLFDLYNNLRGTPLPNPGRMSMRMEGDIPSAFYEAIGYRPLDSIAVRVDIFERVAASAWKISQKGPFCAPIDMMNLIGCGFNDMTQILKLLGYRQVKTEDQILFQRRKPNAKGAGFNPKKTKVKANPNSPFAELARLKDSR